MAMLVLVGGSQSAVNAGGRLLVTLNQPLLTDVCLSAAIDQFCVKSPAAACWILLLKSSDLRDTSGQRYRTILCIASGGQKHRSKPGYSNAWIRKFKIATMGRVLKLITYASAGKSRQDASQTQRLSFWRTGAGASTLFGLETTTSAWRFSKYTFC